MKPFLGFLLVILLEGKTAECAEGVVVKLVNGSSPCAGRVEVHHDRHWGTVDGYSYDYGYVRTWDMKAAAVVCKEVGCGAPRSASVGAQFGKGSGYIITYNVRCRGNESALSECHSVAWDHYFRSRSNDAGVTCSDPLQKIALSLKPDSRVLLRGQTAEISCTGRCPGRKFSFFRGDELIGSGTAPERSNTAAVTLPVIGAGKYWCECAERPAGRAVALTASEPVGISVRDPLVKPTMSLKPDARVFLKGEVAAISCSGNYPGSKFSLHRDREFIESQEAPADSGTAAFTPTAVSPGKYWCQYTALLGGQEFTSPESERQAISTRDPLQKPIISLRPDTRAFAKGEGADIKCSGNYPGSRFDLYRDGDLITSQAAPARIGAATFALAEIAAGKYWCTYTKRLGGRAFTSPESERVGIAVWDALEKPTISLMPDTRSVARGEGTAIVCSGNYPGGNFSLYRDGEFIASQPAREDNNTATFTTRSEEVGAGTYWCTYTKRIGGREFASPESERVGSSEDESWTRTHIAGLALGIATTVAITLFVLGFFMYRREVKVRVAPQSVPTAEAERTYTDMSLRNWNGSGDGATADRFYAATSTV